MKSLNRTLSLVLVLCMVFGLFGVAGAAFTDTTSSKYTQAINVMTGIGVINGTTSTTFEPTASLTREQAAKIITYLALGPTNAAQITSASSQKFTDVAKDRWSAGYIEYCANAGIISGMGDGTFAPTGTLTTLAWTKMLLCALGYKSDVEGFTGAGWAISVATAAVTAGVTDSTISLSSTAVATREQACQLAFKALTAKTVQYTGGSTMTVNGVTITTGATRSFVPHDAATGYLSAGNDAFTQFCEGRFPKLVLTTSNDKFSRPANIWTYDGTALGAYANETPVASWTAYHHATATDTTVADALANYSFGATTDLYTNGTKTTPALDAAGVAALTANGTVVEVYAASGVVTRVVVIKTVLATITNKDLDNKTVTVSDGTNAVTLTANSSTTAFGSAYAALYAMKVDDEILITEKNNGAGVITAIMSYAVPTTVSGQYTASSTSTVTIGGKAYGVSASFTPALTLGTYYTVTLDTYGYVINSTTYTASTTYALMVQGSRDGTAMAGYTYNAQLLFADGTSKWVQIASMNGNADATTLGTAVGYTNKFVSYTATSTGTFALTDVSAAQDTLTTVTVTKNSPSFNGKTVSNSTIFVINVGTSTSPVYKVYTGIKNVPTTTITGYGLVSSGVYKLIVASAATSTTADAIYIYNDVPTTTTYVNAGLTTNTFNAIVNGVKTTITAKNSEFTTTGMFIGNTYSSGIVAADGTDSATTIAANTTFGGANANTVYKHATAATNTFKLADGVLTFTGAHTISGVVSDTFACYYVNATAKTCIAKTLTSTNFAVANVGAVYFVIDSNGYIAYAIIVD